MPVAPGVCVVYVSNRIYPLFGTGEMKMFRCIYNYFSRSEMRPVASKRGNAISCMGAMRA